MLAIRIPEVRSFMQRFLRDSLFDGFFFLEGKLSLETSFSFDGKILSDYYSEEEKESLGISDQIYIPWKLERQRIDAILRGSRTPGFFQFTLGLREEDGTLCLFTARYKNAELMLTTGISRTDFTLSREPKELWDERFLGILKDGKIAVELS